VTLAVSCHARGATLVKQVMTENIEALRRHGFGVAYRMLGTVADAEDVVQEALVRLARVDEHLDEPAAWVTTVTTRLAIDHLRRERGRRGTPLERAAFLLRVVFDYPSRCHS